MVLGPHSFCEIFELFYLHYDTGSKCKSLAYKRGKLDELG